MQRDYSPTYWFRVMRAEQLLNLYQTDRSAFRELVEEYRNATNPARGANDRLMVWLKCKGTLYRTAGDLKKAEGLVKALDDPKLFGFTLAAKPSGDPRSLFAGFAVRHRHAVIYRFRNAPAF